MHCCFVSVKIPRDMPTIIGKRVVRRFILPVLDEFGYVPPEPDIQNHMNEHFHVDGEQKELCMAFYLTDEEAMKTASIRAEWKPREETPLDKYERKALRKMSKKRKRKRTTASTASTATTACPICLETCTKPITINCDHTFCYDCIRKWIGIKRNCPVCHEEINVQKYVRKKRLKIPDKNP